MANPSLTNPAIIQRVSIPKDSNASPMQLVPSKITLATTYDTTVSTSTQVTFNAGTTFIEVSAISQPIVMKWGTTAVTTSNFDNIIMAGTTRHFVVPVDNATPTGFLYTAANFIEQTTSAVLCVTEF